MTQNIGIDYGRGLTNINHKTKIRYGVIPANDVCQAWCDDSTPVYPELDGEDFDDSEPIAFEYNKEGYKLEQSYDDSDIFILNSPFYTYAQFCSPCAPGACHLRNPIDMSLANNKCYCLGHAWFEDGKAPYKVYSFETGEEVTP